MIVHAHVGVFAAIHLSDVDDVRPLLQYYSQFDDPAKEFRRRAIFLQEQVLVFIVLSKGIGIQL